ncbi:MAG: MFS transporter, partial [Streptosporangiaceae bacterium]|nr:MFS transporter [Streptosporangiaceae bacterium]
GFATWTAALVTLVYGLIRAGDDGWSDTWVIACLAAAAVLLAAFVAVEARAAHPMFDLALLRIPTFSGGAIAAFAMNGSLYAMLLYLVIYLQDILGYSALGAGLRLAIISGATLVTATAAGRASEHVPVRWLIGPGLILVGAGLFLMGGLTAASAWTHLVPGFIVAGLGAGLVNPPLASTAIGVVPPHRAGMGSGINSTFRQIGIATGIAALGSVFTAAIQRNLEHAGPLGISAPRLVAAVKQGQPGRLLASLPPAERGHVAAALRSAFTAGLDDLLVITGILALAGAVCALLLIRSKDFVARGEPGPQPSAGEQAGTEAGSEVRSG